MEAGGDVRGRPPVLASLVPEAQHLDTVRALHQTVVALRVALEKSRAELQELRQKVQTHIDTSVYVDTIERLSLENHVLRQRVLSASDSSDGHAQGPGHAAGYALRRDTPSPGAATYTLSPVPEAMDKVASPLSASPREK
ncbi:Uncharacterized protein GBIM_18855 [Gryllus bimaculatus]|nr:Uncharacterized protein GBIM_18855 [Gryllus bimaculatus]